MLNENKGMPEPEKDPESSFEKYFIQEENNESEIQKQRLAELHKLYIELREKLVAEAYQGSIADFIQAEDSAMEKIKTAKPGQKPELRPDQKIFEVINEKFREIAEGINGTPPKSKNKNEEKKSVPLKGQKMTKLEKIIEKIKGI